MEAVLTFHPMSLRYRSGEEVHAGDRVLYNSVPSQIEFVAKADDPDTAWYIELFGNGCMILAPGFGRVFVSDPQEDEDLEFAGQGEGVEAGRVE